MLWQKAEGWDDYVVWAKSAYPQAYYYLGYLEIEAGRYDEAVCLLKIGHRLEPTNPKFAIEQARAIGRI